MFGEYYLVVGSLEIRTLIVFSLLLVCFPLYADDMLRTPEYVVKLENPSCGATYKIVGGETGNVTPCFCLLYIFAVLPLFSTLTRLVQWIIGFRGEE